MPATNYVHDLRRAIAFTRSLGCTTRPPFNAGPSMAGEQFREIIREWARLNLVPRPDDRVAGRCLEITHELVEFLAGAGIEGIFTLGWMSFEGKPVYRFTRADVHHWMATNSIDRDKIDMHAWVTLPSGEIIDASWLSTVGIVRFRRELIGAVIIAEPARPESHRYHPVLVDTAILTRLGLLNPTADEFPARESPSAQDLPVVDATVVSWR